MRNSILTCLIALLLVASYAHADDGNSTVVGGATNATCLSGSIPFVIASTCPAGFYCPFLPSPPTFCSPTTNCTVLRLKGDYCDAQGTTNHTIYSYFISP